MKFRLRSIQEKLFTTLSAILLLISVASAQNNAAQPELESGTIESQFDYIITKSSSFKDFQLIRKASILKVRKNTLDSLKSIQENYVEAKAAIAPLQNQIQALESEIITLKSDVAAAEEGKDSINVLGNLMNKTSYNTFVWSLVAVLVVALLFFVLQFKNSHLVTKKAKNEAESTENDLEEFKKKAMKKEQELMRKLQDELNKNSQG